jgi:hypothetical protein
VGPRDGLDGGRGKESHSLPEIEPGRSARSPVTMLAELPRLSEQPIRIQIIRLYSPHRDAAWA